MLEIQNLHISSGTNSLVKGISLQMNRSEIFSLVGESGSGKSLTCLSLLNLLPSQLKTTGNILFTDSANKTHELTNMSQVLRSELALKKIAYVFQEPLTALNPVQTCGKQLHENIALCGYKGKSVQKALAEKLLKDVELYDTQKVLTAYPFQLSGGQRQRVMIAMALAGNPELIIADEPTTALDVLLQDGILSLLRKICVERGSSVLLVSHDIDAVAKYSDRIAVMYKGEIVETGNTDSILNSPQNLYTKALLACKPRADKKGIYLSTLSDTMQSGGDHFKRFPSEPLEGKVQASLNNTGKDFKSNGKIYTALKEVSFEIKKGSSTGLIGESGSGKSTISRLLVQLEDSDRGQIVYDFDNKDELSSNVQMIFQDPFAALNPSIQVEQMLKEVINKHQSNIKNARQECILLLEKVGLQASDLSKYPSQFSGGQRQRLCIARALAAKPQLLICDESTSALDLSVQAQILNLLKELQLKEQLSILMVTHSMSVAAWFCNYLIVLKNGEIIEQGKTEDLIHNPKQDYTKVLLTHA